VSSFSPDVSAAFYVECPKPAAIRANSGDTRPDPESGPLISLYARDRTPAMAGMARYGPARRAGGRFEP
jgi:hypothetical protein